MDDAETNRKFAESLSLNYPILSDPSKEVAGAFGVLNDRQMANRWTFYIDQEGKIAKIDQQVKPDSSGTDLVTNLEALGFPKK